MMRDIYIVSAKRTPHGKFGGSLKGTGATTLGGIAVKGALEASGLSQDSIEEVIFGNVIQAGNGPNPAGQCSTFGGIRPEVTKNTVNVVCASGMLAIENAYREIALGEKDIIIAGGTESMSRAPYLVSSNFRYGVKNMFGKNEAFTDSMYNDGLLDAFYLNSMGYYADLTSAKYEQSRKIVDEFALQSQERALKASKSGYFRDEIIPMDELGFDEGIRETSMEMLSKLRPAFNKDGVNTAGNSSQISDGASAVVLASQQAVEQYNLKPIAKINGFWSSSMDPRDFIEAPIKSTKELLDRNGWNMKDFDLVEHNEAFSGGCILLRDQLGINNDSFNVNGGAIAFGHPLGSSGSRIVVTLLHALRQRKLQKGIATLCHGGGGGHSMAIEVVN